MLIIFKTIEETHMNISMSQKIVEIGINHNNRILDITLMANAIMENFANYVMDGSN